MQKRLDPRIAHRLGRELAILIVNRPHGVDVRDVAEDFARYLSSREGGTHDSWQEAWNRWVGAVPTMPGQVTVRSRRCLGCQGRRYDTRRIARNIARTGTPYVCGECRGSGSGGDVTLRARYAVPPRSNPDPSPSTGA